MKIGYIGSSPISKFHISALIKNGFSIDGIGSRKDSIRCKKLAEEFKLHTKYCKGGWQEVLEKNVDAFCLCIDIASTGYILEKILDIGKPTLVEKPVSWNLTQFDRLLNHPNSSKVFVAYNRRYYQTIKKFKTECDKSSGGTISVNIPDTTPGIIQFLSNGCHIVDILRFTTGDLKIKSKTIRMNKENSDIESISALCENEKWKILFNAHSLIPSNFSISLNSGQKVFELKPIEKFSIYEGIDIVEPTVEEPIRIYSPSLKESFIEPSELKPGFDQMYKNFKRFIIEKKGNACDLLEARKTLEFSLNLIKGNIPKKLEKKIKNYFQKDI